MMALFREMAADSLRQTVTVVVVELGREWR